ncbi:hypothetical protein EI94DRAFT_715489 [Lactarius quietus]|nr:hypothetical protein EI94DRAFT_715489 [Lactarius quietus]
MVSKSFIAYVCLFGFTTSINAQVAFAPDRGDEHFLMQRSPQTHRHVRRVFSRSEGPNLERSPDIAGTTTHSISDTSSPPLPVPHNDVNRDIELLVRRVLARNQRSIFQRSLNEFEDANVSLHGVLTSTSPLSSRSSSLSINNALGAEVATPPSPVSLLRNGQVDIAPVVQNPSALLGNGIDAIPSPIPASLPSKPQVEIAPVDPQIPSALLGDSLDATPSPIPSSPPNVDANPILLSPSPASSPGNGIASAPVVADVTPQTRAFKALARAFASREPIFMNNTVSTPGYGASAQSSRHNVLDYRARATPPTAPPAAPAGSSPSSSHPVVPNAGKLLSQLLADVAKAANADSADRRRANSGRAWSSRRSVVRQSRESTLGAEP